MIDQITESLISDNELNGLLDDRIKELRGDQTPTLRTANERLSDARDQPEILPLLPSIWMTNELHILFADTGVGKSLLAVQICDALSKGENIFNLEKPIRPYKVSFYDFELTDRQFLKRYSDDFGNSYSFSNNFFIDSIDFAELMTKSPDRSIEELVCEIIEKDLEKNKPDIIVIDNITYLNGQSTQETKIAQSVMRWLNILKRASGISILVLAHTPKRDQSSVITINDLAGSKQLANFADSISTIGTNTNDARVRYIKQVKASRSSEMLYDTQNVITCEIVKTKTFLGFEFMNYSYEKEHLAEKGEKERNEQKQIAIGLLEGGKSIREVATEMGIGKSKVGRWNKELSQTSQEPSHGDKGHLGH